MIRGLIKLVTLFIFVPSGQKLNKTTFKHLKGSIKKQIDQLFTFPGSQEQKFIASIVVNGTWLFSEWRDTLLQIREKVSCDFISRNSDFKTGNCKVISHNFEKKKLVSVETSFHSFQHPNERFTSFQKAVHLHLQKELAVFRVTNPSCVRSPFLYKHRERVKKHP